jgi:hypothetical protein
VAADFVGIQVGPISFVDEGVDAVLDTLQEKGAVNALIVPPLTWDDSVAGRADYGDPGHGIVGTSNLVGGAFWQPDPAFYRKGLITDFRAPDPAFEGIDVLQAVGEAAAKRGMKLYPYFFESSIWDRPVEVPNFAQVVEVDAYGRKGARPCLFNPDYEAWMLSAIEDVCRNYDVAGILWGLERQGPLMTMLEGGVPACFCDHCQAHAARNGVDMVRVRDGYREVDAYLNAARAGASQRDGYFVSFLRILLNHPEVLQWEKLWLDGHLAFYRQIYGLVKFLDPSLEFGLGVWYRITTTNVYLRAQYAYEEFKGSCDWVKPILYHVPAGPRFGMWMGYLGETILRDRPTEEWVDGMYALLHHQEQSLKDVAEDGFSPEYVQRETERMVTALDGEARVHPAIGIGMRNPGGREIQADDVPPAIRAAFDGGADGVILCRMYAEMSLSCLEAAGRTLRELGKG